MQNDNTPGNNGFTKEFSENFWSKIEYVFSEVIKTS